MSPCRILHCRNVKTQDVCLTCSTHGANVKKAKLPMSSDDTRSFSSSFKLDSGNFSDDMTAEQSPFDFDLPPPHKVAEMPKLGALCCGSMKSHSTMIHNHVYQNNYCRPSSRIKRNQLRSFRVKWWCCL